MALQAEGGEAPSGSGTLDSARRMSGTSKVGEPDVDCIELKAFVHARVLTRLSLRAAIVAATLLPLAAVSSEALVADMEQRLRQGGADAANAHLSERPFELALLHRDTEACVLRNVSLVVELSRGRRTRTTDAHADALRGALGRCTGFVLALLSPTEVPRLCSSAPSWTIMQTVRELRRRMRIIEADAVLRTSHRGKACSAACLYELKNTRVGLKAASPPAATRPR
jgi:hypothetical protein